MRVSNKHEMSKIFDSLSDPRRIEALQAISQNKRLATIAEGLRMSRSGFQRFIDSFATANLIRKIDGRYELTYLGKQVLSLLKVLDMRINSLPVEEAKERIGDSVVKYGVGLTRKDLQAILRDLEERFAGEHPND